jgi:hypothetical protein
MVERMLNDCLVMDALPLSPAGKVDRRNLPKPERGETEVGTGFVAARTLTEQRRRTTQVSRLLQLLRAHGLIAKVPHSYRYRITAKGEVVMNTALYMRHRALAQLLELLDNVA